MKDKMKNQPLSKERPKREYQIPEAFLSYGVPSIVNGLLRTDPIAEAEKLTGESYKTSKETMGLGFAMMHQLHRDKDKLLKSNEDSVFPWILVNGKVLFQNWVSKIF